MSTESEVPAAVSHSSVWPRPSRPRFPAEYGAPTETTGLLPWSHVVMRMEQARTYWLCTMQNTGMPHAVPVWGVWLHDTLYFHVAPSTRTGRNLAANPAVAIHLESGDDVVLIKGFVERVRNDTLGPALAAEIAAASRQKYPEVFIDAEPWHYQPHEGEAFAVRMTLAYAWTNLAVDPTRWQFVQQLEQ